MIRPPVVEGLKSEDSAKVSEGDVGGSTPRDRGVSRPLAAPGVVFSWTTGRVGDRSSESAGGCSPLDSMVPSGGGVGGDEVDATGGAGGE